MDSHWLKTVKVADGSGRCRDMPFEAMASARASTMSWEYALKMKSCDAAMAARQVGRRPEHDQACKDWPHEEHNSKSEIQQ